ncbi:hypothetical protein [Heyndrickxia acidicola]|uniref:Homeobox domain-containing protein n=1 Tax=Heyndrickxia acidicola TaxID=209389 RepID=A0ABU6MHS2_9BACI|nr:hypothetical protein [Heyndrickxia acidicola]MED1203943.1 hypothetical protein [Heyndrickxia acidicola]
MEGKRLLRFQQVIGIARKQATMWFHYRPRKASACNGNQPSGMNRTQRMSMYNPNFDLIQRLIGAEGARLLRGSAGFMETPKELTMMRLPAGLGKRAPATEINQQDD